MFFLLIAFIARLCRGFGIFSRNSRFRGINSRLGRYKFPVRMATGIWSQATELPSVFGSEIAAMRAESKKFPVLREKPGMGGAVLPVTPRSTSPGARGLLGIGLKTAGSGFSSRLAQADRTGKIDRDELRDTAFDHCYAE
jgi:hypothetical protein